MKQRAQLGLFTLREEQQRLWAFPYFIIFVPPCLRENALGASLKGVVTASQGERRIARGATSEDA